MVQLLLIIIITALKIVSAVEIIEWTGGMFKFPSESVKKAYLANGNFISKNAIATRAQIFDDNLFVVFPRYKFGIPITLARINLLEKANNDDGTYLTAYPNFLFQEEEKLNGFQNIVDIFVDPFGILWALDIGVVNTLETVPIRKTPPKVLSFDLQTGKLHKTVNLSDVVVPTSRLQYLTVDYGNDGKPFIYISDATRKSILICDINETRNYRIILPQIVLSSKADVLYLTLIRQSSSDDCDGGNYLIISYLSGAKIFSINTEYLRHKETDVDEIIDSNHINDLGMKTKKIILLGTDGGDGLFYRYESKSDVYKWNFNSTIFTEEEGFQVYSSPNCYLPMEVIPDRKNDKMRVLESNFPDYIQGTVGCGASQRLSTMD